MKILHIITSLELGGAEKLLTELIPLQRLQGHTVELLILYDRHKVFDMPYKCCKYNSKTSILNVFEILKEIRKGKYNIVHSHLVHSQIWTGLASLMDFSRKRSYVTTEHSTSNNRREKLIYKYLDKFIFSRYKKVICISEAVKVSLINWLGIKNPKKKYVIIENGVNIDYLRQLKPISRENFNLKNEDIIITMVSRLEKAKDHETLLKAMTLLPKIYKLLIVGEGEREAELKELVKNLKIEKRVQFLGMRQNIGEIFKTSNIAVQSSYFEGFGITAVEAMACGVPLIASDVPGLNDVVRGGGILFSLGNSLELAKKILSLENEVYKNEIREKELIKSEYYSLKISCDKYLSLYKEISI
ncbi:MAG: glycosyltransferase [Fusobacteriaceae bacterium]